jgi:hypothetical protein
MKYQVQVSSDRLFYNVARPVLKNTFSCKAMIMAKT